MKSVAVALVAIMTFGVFAAEAEATNFFQRLRNNRARQVQKVVVHQPRVQKVVVNDHHAHQVQQIVVKPQRVVQVRVQPQRVQKIVVNDYYNNVEFVEVPRRHDFRIQQQVLPFQYQRGVEVRVGNIRVK